MDDKEVKNILPSYKNPPINEVVCGMRFDPPEKIRITHYGLLWEKFREEYPTIKHAQPLSSDKGMLIDTMTGLPLPRVWFINKTDDQLIQFQIDRFYYNWRRRKNEYPRYHKIIGNFEKVFNIIIDFFNESEFGKLIPKEYELSYINHIPQGQGWNDISDHSKIFSDIVWNEKKNRFLPNPNKLAWQTEFLLPKNMGSLSVKLKQSIKIEDKIPLFVLELKAWGINSSQDKSTFREWFDLAHEWIVRGFTDLTESKIQHFWGIVNNV